MPTLEPRKLPRQERSKATVQAILDACGELIAGEGWRRLRTHALADRAGVSVGTLYQYFPNREAVAGALVVRALERLLEAMRRALGEAVARNLGSLPATEHLLLTALEVLSAERAVFGRLGVEAPQLYRTSVAADLQRSLINLSQEIRLTGGDTLDLPMPEADAWIIGHMVAASMVQISQLSAPLEQRQTLAREVARLTCRMALSHSQNPLQTSPAAAGEGL